MDSRVFNYFQKQSAYYVTQLFNHRDSWAGSKWNSSTHVQLIPYTIYRLIDNPEKTYLW